MAKSKLTRAKFEEAIEEALDLLPPLLKEKIENLEIILEEWPSRELWEEMGLSSPGELLGLYQGVPRPARGFHYALVLPDVITIYQGPIEELGRNYQEIKLLIRDVLYHEIGHYYGFTEEQLESLEEIKP